RSRPGGRPPRCPCGAARTRRAGDAWAWAPRFEARTMRGAAKDGSRAGAPRGFREGAPRDHQGRPARVARLMRSYPTTQDDLWDAITNPERIPRWFMPVSGDLRPGGHYQLEGNAGG